MEYSQETRRYLAKVSRIGIVAATLFALLYGLTVYIPMYKLYKQIGSVFYMIRSVSTGHPMLISMGVGVLVVAVCGVLSSFWRRSKPDLTEKAWIIGGKIMLLSIPAGFIQGLSGISVAVLSQTTIVSEYLFAFTVLAAVFVGFALGRRGISLNQSFLKAPTKTYTLRVLRNTAILFGVVLVSVLILMLRVWLPSRADMETMSTAARLTLFVLHPLRCSAPVALSVILGYPVLSIAARLDESPNKRFLGKGSLLLLWISLGLTAVTWGTKLAWNRVAMGYGADRYALLNKLGAWWLWVGAVAAFAAVWMLCRVVTYGRDSKAVLWGAGGLLGVILLRELLLGWGIRVLKLILQAKKQNNASMGIIGGTNMITTVQTAKLEAWGGMLFTVLAAIALCVLAVGLIRRFRVSKAFWVVPVLTALSVVVLIAVDLLWATIFDDVTPCEKKWLNWPLAALIPTLPTFLASVVGTAVLACAPDSPVIPPPPPTEGAEAPKPRVEDYLYQL